MKGLGVLRRVARRANPFLRRSRAWTRRAWPVSRGCWAHFATDARKDPEPSEASAESDLDPDLDPNDPRNWRISKEETPLRDVIDRKDGDSYRYMEATVEDFDEDKFKIHWGQVVGISVLFGGAVLFYQWKQGRDERQAMVSRLQTGQSYLGTPDIGGHFRLLDTSYEENDAVVFDTRLVCPHTYIIVYFGFTHCPDVCPAELIKLKRALDIIEKQDPEVYNKLLPVFISVDPARDTYAALRKFGRKYHRKTRYLRSDLTATENVARQFRAYFSIPDIQAGNQDYLVDHSFFFYLMDRDCQLIKYYGKDDTARFLSQDLVAQVREDMKKDWTPTDDEGKPLPVDPQERLRDRLMSGDSGKKA